MQRFVSLVRFWTHCLKCEADKLTVSLRKSLQRLVLRQYKISCCKLLTNRLRERLCLGRNVRQLTIFWKDYKSYKVCIANINPSTMSITTFHLHAFNTQSSPTPIHASKRPKVSFPNLCFDWSDVKLVSCTHITSDQSKHKYRKLTSLHVYPMRSLYPIEITGFERLAGTFHFRCG